MSDEQLSVREAYLEQMVESASREGLLMMLVDGAVNFIRRAGHALEKGKLDEAHTYLVKAQDIYLELTVSMDLDAGEFAENLAKVYQYLYNLLIEANMEKSAAKIETSLRLATEIRNLWKETIDRAQSESGISPKTSKEQAAPSKAETPKSTGVYEPAGGSRLAASKPHVEESQSRLNLTG
jgi:flagellar protein FliS